MGSLYALDFDGVLCDSCGESSISALKAAKVRWPELFTGVEPETEDWILDNMRTVEATFKGDGKGGDIWRADAERGWEKGKTRVRPVVETGYENLLLARLLLEIKKPMIQKSSVAPGLTVERILENWSKLKPVIMMEWGESSEELVELFGKVRDEWLEHDLSGWIGANRFYPGTADALRFASSEVYIVTTKQARFAEALLQKLAGVSIPPERIYGLGTGPKVEVLKQLQSKPEHSGLTLHFVEDRLATLKNVIKEPHLDKWNLYLGTWGYNTPSEREEANTFSRINLVDLHDFCAKLKCEPPKLEEKNRSM